VPRHAEWDFNSPADLRATCAHPMKLNSGRRVGSAYRSSLLGHAALVERRSIPVLSTQTFPNSSVAYSCPPLVQVMPTPATL
jgi:hypothetical protein